MPQQCPQCSGGMLLQGPASNIVTRRLAPELPLQCAIANDCDDIEGIVTYFYYMTFTAFLFWRNENSKYDG